MNGRLATSLRKMNPPSLVVQWGLWFRQLQQRDDVA
jgi:hypothetical protein